MNDIFAVDYVHTHLALMILLSGSLLFFSPFSWYPLLVWSLFSILIFNYPHPKKERWQKGTQRSAIKHFFQNKECPITNQEEYE